MTVATDHITGIEVRHLAALEAVAEEGSFRRAATRLGYVQSAISEQIAALERIVGQRLVERSRGPGPVALTEAGEVLLGHAKAIVARIKRAKLFVFLRLASATGLRRGSICGLRWSDIDTRARTLRHHRSIGQGRGAVGLQLLRNFVEAA